MINKIVHISFSSLTPILAEALYVPQCLEKKISVEWLDLADIFGFPTNHHSENYKTIIVKPKNIEELTSYLSSLESSSILINIQFYFEWRFIKFFKILTTLKGPILSTFSMGDIPLYPAISTTRLKKLLSPRFLFNKIIQTILFRIYVYTGTIKLPEIYFCAAKNHPPFTPKNAMYFPINYIDYDRFVRFNTHATQEKKQIVFLDISLATHPDLHFYGIKFNEVDGEQYRNDLNSFFAFLEKKYSLPVVIAAHPKSNYSAEYFNYRAIIQNDVLNLVANAILVIGHHSTSTSYAVAYNKPVVFFYSNVILKNSSEKLPVPLLIETFSKMLDAPCLNISTPYEDFEIPKINAEAYRNFLQSYMIGKNLENKDSATIFIDYLKTIKA